VQSDAPVDDAIGDYLRSLERASEIDLLQRTDRSGWHRIMVAAVDVHGDGGGAVSTGAPARFSVTLTGLQPSTSCNLTVLNNLGQPVFKMDSGNASPGDRHDDVPRADEPVQFVCDVPALPLLPGRYRIDVQLRGTHQIEDQIDAAALFDVEAGVLAGRPVASTSTGDVTLEHRWTVPTLLPATS